tara:strand:- start:707 stop:928 length:222 start_codon:yes stop_codon:yes gene_type:complete
VKSGIFPAGFGVGTEDGLVAFLAPPFRLAGFFVADFFAAVLGADLAPDFGWVEGDLPAMKLASFVDRRTEGYG